MHKNDYVGVDLDSTLATYEVGDYNRKGALVFGEPIPAMVELVKSILARGITVKVFTARMPSLSIPEVLKIVNSSEGDFDYLEFLLRPQLEANNEMQKAIGDWTKKHIGRRLKATNQKDGFCHLILDDRAIGVEGNTGKLLSSNSRLEKLLALPALGDEQ